MSDLRKKASLVVACAFAGAGVVLGLRAVLPARTRHASAPVEAGTPSLVLPIFSLAVNPEFETSVTPETVSQVAEQVGDKVKSQVRSKSVLAALGADMTTKLVAATQEQMEIYLAGSFDRYTEFQRRSGGRREYVEAHPDGSEARTKALSTVKSVWESMAETIALHPISLDEVTVRLRSLDGKVFPTPDDRTSTTTVTMPDRWPALAGDPAANKYTIIELMVPVFYFRASGAEPPVQAPVYFSIWFVWDKAAREWRIHQTRLYNPMRIANLICPQF